MPTVITLNGTVTRVAAVVACWCCSCPRRVTRSLTAATASMSSAARNAVIPSQGCANQMMAT